MTLQLHSDGCIVTPKGNVYVATYAPKCPHTQIKSVVIELTHSSLEWATVKASHIQIPQMILVSVEEKKEQ